MRENGTTLCPFGLFLHFCMIFRVKIRHFPFKTYSAFKVYQGPFKWGQKVQMLVLGFKAQKQPKCL